MFSLVKLDWLYKWENNFHISVDTWPNLNVHKTFFWRPEDAIFPPIQMETKLQIFSHYSRKNANILLLCWRISFKICFSAKIIFCRFCKIIFGISEAATGAVLLKKLFLEITKIAGKHLRQSLFFNKVAELRPTLK